MNTATTANIQIIILLPFTTSQACLNFTNCTAYSFHYSGNTGNTFYDWCEIGSIYGAPSDCIWGGGRTSFGYSNPGRRA